MRQIIDQERVNRNAMLSNIASIGGLFTLLASVLLPLFLPNLIDLFSHPDGRRSWRLHGRHLLCESLGSQTQA